MGVTYEKGNANWALLQSSKTCYARASSGGDNAIFSLIYLPIHIQNRDCVGMGRGCQKLVVNLNIYVIWAVPRLYILNS